jgi:Tol biopolymer transport system component
VRATAPENAVVWIADADGSNGRPLARGTAGVVSPRGRTIAIGRSDGIHLVSSDGKHDRHVTSNVLNPQAWSPDGRLIIAGVAKLAAVDVDSGRVRVFARGAFFGFAFSPDGRRLVYSRAPGERTGGLCGPLGSHSTFTPSISTAVRRCG